YTLATPALKFSSVGDYAITVTLGSNSNYNVGKTDNTLSIGQKNASVAADHKDKTYEEDNPALTATVTGTVNGDVLAYTLATPALKFSSVGDYAITVTLGANTNYNVAKTDNTPSTTHNHASVAADHKGKTYGEDNPALTATVTGTGNGDVLAYTLSTPALKFSSVGDYAITVTLGSNSNYNVAKTDNTLSIGQKDASVAADHKGKTYGDDRSDERRAGNGTVNGDRRAYNQATPDLKLRC